MLRNRSRVTISFADKNWGSCESLSEEPVKDVNESKMFSSEQSFPTVEGNFNRNSYHSRKSCQAASTSFAMSNLSISTSDEYSLPLTAFQQIQTPETKSQQIDTFTDSADYDLPMTITFRTRTAILQYESYNQSFDSDASEYSLPLIAPDFNSASFISLNGSTSSDSHSEPLSDEGYETRTSLEKETLENTHILRNRTRASDVCLSCEEEEQFHRSHKSKHGKSVLPKYNSEQILTIKSQHTFIDTHCHLDFLFNREKYSGTYSAYQQKHKASFPVTYEGCVAVFCNPFTFAKKPMWEKFLAEKNVWAAFGCHPHNSKDFSDQHEKYLLAALDHPQVRALGEIGLDYSSRNNCQKTIQHKVFRRQLRIALARELPLVIHCREANEDTMNIMKEILPLDYKIHLHCFTDVWEYAKKWLNIFPNLYIGITNLVTFSSADCVHKVVKNIPLDRLLLETDAPYFVPKVSPKGTRFSHPGMAIHVAAQIAALRDTSLEEVLYWTRRNTNSVYGI